MGWRKPEQIVIPLEQMYKKRGIEFIVCPAEKVVPDENRIDLTGGRSVTYDFLVIATGPALAFDEIPGLGPSGGHTQSICLTDHADRAYAMLMPPFKGVSALEGIEGLVNPRGFVITDSRQRNPKFPNVFAIGVCVAIAPPEKTPVPTGVPKTGFMIESTAMNIRALMDGKAAEHEPTLNAVCLADFGNSGVGFVAIPQIPPRNVNRSSRGKHIHIGKIAFEKYFMHKVRSGVSEPFYEKYIMKMLGVDKVKTTK